MILVTTCFGFALEAAQSLRVLGHVFRQKLESDEAIQPLTSALYTTPIPHRTSRRCGGKR